MTRTPGPSMNPWAYRELECSSCGQTVRTNATADPSLPRDPAHDLGGWPQHRCNGVVRDFDIDNGPVKREAPAPAASWAWAV